MDRNYTANGLNQLTSAGATALTYDVRGNLTQSGSDAYSYTSENFMKTGPGGALLAYDPLGRLYATAATASAETRFAYDGLALIGEYNNANALLRRYVHGPGIDQPIVWYEGAGTSDRRFLMTDERGSIVSVTNSAGAVLKLNSYDEYGIPADNLGRFGYTGQTWVPELGLNYYKARMYSPTLGRFMQTDPIGYADGMNWYNYVGSDPVNFVDPLGLKWIRKCVAVGTGKSDCGWAWIDQGGLGSSFGSVISDNIRKPPIQRFEEPQNEAQKKLCQGLAQDDTGEGVSPFVRNFPNVWNDTSRLQFHMDYANQRAASNEAFSNFADAGTIPAGAAALTSGAVGKIAAAKATGAVGLFVTVIGKLTSLSAAAQRTAAISINARIRRLNAIEAGICPES